MTAVDTLPAALALAARGVPAFPCLPGLKRPASPAGFKDATTDPDTLRAMWAATPGANVAIPTGAASGLMVLDVDGDDGRDSLAELERRHEPLPATVTVVTPRGGEHRYFRHPGRVVPCSASRMAPHVDVRADGGYVLVPPSVSEQGRAYEYDQRHPVAPAPAWLLAANSPRAGSPNGQAPDWVALLRRGLGEGERNTGIAALAGHLLRRRVDPYVALELADAFNAARCRPALPPDEVRGIVESISRREADRRARSVR